MTAQKRDRLARIVKRLIAARGSSSPEDLARTFQPEASPLSARALRRLMSGEDERLESEDGEMKLILASRTLRLPAQTLGLIYDGDADGIRRLEFDGEESIRQFILDLMEPPGRTVRATRRAR